MDTPETASKRGAKRREKLQTTSGENEEKQ